MPYLEYPKHVYLDGDVSKESRRVENADDEAAAEDAGFLALPAHPPIEDAQPGGAKHLPYPKILYVGGLIDGETRRVENADDEAAAGDDGFLALVAVDAADEDENPGNVDEAKPKRGRKPKKQ